jgi:hypothetical protein
MTKLVQGALIHGMLAFLPHDRVELPLLVDGYRVVSCATGAPRLPLICQDAIGVALPSIATKPAKRRTGRDTRNGAAKRESKSERRWSKRET